MKRLTAMIIFALYGLSYSGFLYADDNDEQPQRHHHEHHAWREHHPHQLGRGPGEQRYGADQDLDTLAHPRHDREQTLNPEKWWNYSEMN